METLNGRKNFVLFLEQGKKKLKESFDLSVPFTLREYIPAIEEIIRCVFSFHYIFAFLCRKNAKKLWQTELEEGADTNGEKKEKTFYRKTSLPSIA